MTREEFNERVTKQVTVQEYKIIDFVYNFHPAIDNVNGKNQIVMIYEHGGMQVIKDMESTANKGREMIKKMQALRYELDELSEAYKRLAYGT